MVRAQRDQISSKRVEITYFCCFANIFVQLKFLWGLKTYRNPNTDLHQITPEGLLVSVYYVAVRTIVLSRHGSNLEGLLSFMISFMALYMCQVLHVVDFLGVSPDGKCAYVHWGSFTSNSKSVRRAIWFTWFSEPHECIQHLAVPGGHPSNYEPGATLLSFSDRAQTVKRTPYSVYITWITWGLEGFFKPPSNRPYVNTVWYGINRSNSTLMLYLTLPWPWMNYFVFAVFL